MTSAPLAVTLNGRQDTASDYETSVQAAQIAVRANHFGEPDVAGDQGSRHFRCVFEKANRLLPFFSQRYPGARHFNLAEVQR